SGDCVGAGGSPPDVFTLSLPDALPISVNDYLARRDADWMGQIHRFLGLTVGLVVPEVEDWSAKREAYLCDITYGTNSEFGFDYLDRKSTRLNSSHVSISYAHFCLKKKY